MERLIVPAKEGSAKDMDIVKNVESTIIRLKRTYRTVIVSKRKLIGNPKDRLYNNEVDTKE
ncbi:MAG TPA: hypothetical protein VHP81_00580 [Lachnospiraceae bacterium]|nr:hypothetical protein [Lachnospiraceae bacterium]